MIKVGNVFVDKIRILYIQEQQDIDYKGWGKHTSSIYHEVICNGMRTGITGDEKDCQNAVYDLLEG